MPTSDHDDNKPKRNEKGHWLPGSSGNPGGRPRVAKYIYANTNNLEDVLDIVLKILANPKSDRQLQWAIDFLADRSIGKPSQHQITEQTTNIVVDKPEDTELDE